MFNTVLCEQKKSRDPLNEWSARRVSSITEDYSEA